MPDINFTDETLCIDSALALGFSAGIGSASFVTYIMVNMIGSTDAKARLSRTSWYRHQKVLKHAGLLHGRAPLDNLCALPRGKRGVEGATHRTRSDAARLIRNKIRDEVTA